ncbi:Uncharacterized protein Fot_13830 [Forsythia ovata]|uniref:Uncharacterized protein n=1 Tax=Forsythia ovata TaxID=205694 RepID=A0ABD1W4V6_9LAMI
MDENEDIYPQPLMPRTASIPEVVIPQASKEIVGTSTAVPLASRIAVDISSVLPLEEILLPSEDIQRLGKRNTVADDEREAVVPRRCTDGNGGSGDSQKMKRDQEAPSWGVEEHAFYCSRGTARPDPLFLLLASSNISISSFVRMN